MEMAASSVPGFPNYPSKNCRSTRFPLAPTRNAALVSAECRRYQSPDSTTPCCLNRQVKLLVQHFSLTRTQRMALLDKPKWLTLVMLAVTFGALAAAFAQTDIEGLFPTLKRVSPAIVVLAALSLLTGALLAVLRLWVIASDIGHRLSIRDTMLALSVGQLAGAATVQFFGHIVARTALLSRRGVTTSVNIAIASYERLIAVAVAFTLAVAGASYLFGNLALNLRAGGAQLLFVGAGIICAFTASALLGWGAVAFHQLREHFHSRFILSLARTAIITFFIQISTAAAYVIVAASLSPQTPLIELGAASLVVMFAASLPISFAGWGGPRTQCRRSANRNRRSRFYRDSRCRPNRIACSRVCDACRGNCGYIASQQISHCGGAALLPNANH
jgi:uncharacterized membrane protein YbhN (UPF0104 family)